MDTGSEKWHDSQYAAHGNAKTSEKRESCEIIDMNPSCHVSHTCKALSRLRSTLRRTLKLTGESAPRRLSLNSKVFGKAIENDRYVPSTTAIRVPWGENLVRIIWKSSYGLHGHTV